MANIDAPDLTYKSQHIHTYGNLGVAHVSFTPVPQPNALDVIRFMRLPADVKLLDCMIIFSEGTAATSTLDLGFTHVDGSAGDNPDYFLDAADTEGTLLHRGLAMVLGIQSPTKDVYITGTVNTADWDSNPLVDLWVSYEFKGHG
jgi:hypothetical protein